ncbi:extracellular solute-binding protein [Agromyces silvae]|uniref:extracellular solute-binding protein n=1 Tax=Agromyces silvae TaxID=3388266 RepID=UPI00280B2AAC|nr:extracellular solute-binding protein [Agromyces protaetiae]
MTKRFMIGAVVAAAALALTGCAGSGEPAGGGAAEAEDLIIYSSRAEPITDYVVEEFETAYPEYEGKVQIVNLGAGDIPERVRAESGNPQASLWWGGTQQNLAAGVAGDLLAAWPDAPFADEIDDAFKDAEGRWYAEYQLPQVIVYNSDVLSADEAPQDWDELIDPAWKDQIVIRDVAPSGGMRSIFDAMILRESPDGSDPEPGYEYLRALDANTVTYAADPSDLYLQLSRQAGTISAWNMQDTLIQINQNKMPFEFIVPESGTPVLVDGLGIINGAPNEEGAKLFAEFLYEPDVRAALADEFYQIPVTGLESEPEWLEGLTITPMEVDWSIAAENEATWIDYWSNNIKNQG